MAEKGRSHKKWKEYNEHTNLFISAENNSKKAQVEMKDRLEKDGEDKKK